MLNRGATSEPFDPDPRVPPPNPYSTQRWTSIRPSAPRAPPKSRIECVTPDSPNRAGRGASSRTEPSPGKVARTIPRKSPPTAPFRPAHRCPTEKPRCSICARRWPWRRGPKSRGRREIRGGRREVQEGQRGPSACGQTRFDGTHGSHRGQATGSREQDQRLGWGRREPGRGVRQRGQKFEGKGSDRKVGSTLARFPSRSTADECHSESRSVTDGPSLFRENVPTA